MDNARYTSDHLFHLVGRACPTDHEANYQTLLQVLDSECISHPPHTSDWGAHQYTINWDENIFTEKLIIPTVTCFCDIPLEHLQIHTKKYGLFGLSFPRDYLISYGARPVIYIPLQRNDHISIIGRSFLHDLEQVWRGFREHVVDANFEGTRTRTLGIQPNSSESAIAAVDDLFTQHFLAFIKPFDSELPDDHPDNYYLEREWRKYGNLRFQPHQVRRVLVAKEYVDRFKNDRPAYSNIIEAL
ncbi:MAG TPA: abortive infection system antitoxin AbiGi family protein [Pyrinomonadaceae bacterium]|jgi:hypothetical protein|nr:abortive infection system antitoxin AbiGi family protein [Pyrinomonadaceae bacterium]